MMIPLAVVTRDNYVESLHYGFICVVDASGRILHHVGDSDTRIFFRSSAKPIQAIPLIQSGAADAFGFSPKDIAIACASHSGQKIHQLTVREILSRLDLDVNALHCGTMTPYNETESKRLTAEGENPSVLHCSCSGKHSGMLALARHRGYSLDDYERKSHPIQQEIMGAIAEFAEEDIHTIPTGVDGCGVPIYLLPIYKIALSYAKLTAYAQDEQSPYHQSCKRVFDSMAQHPEMVAGDYEFDTELMQAAQGKLIAKVGCEAVYCIGVAKGNLGICIKIIDGNERAVYPVVVELLRELGVLDEGELHKLQKWHKYPLKNNLDEQIGEIVSVLRINESVEGMELLGKNLYKTPLFA